MQAIQDDQATSTSSSWFSDPNVITPYTICCIGAGYVGGPTSAVIAYKNPRIAVHVVDLNETRIQEWNSEILPVDEPDLLSLVRIGRDGTDGRIPNLHFSTDIARAIDEANMIFIAVDTPPKISGCGAHQALDISRVEAVVEIIALHSTTDKIIVEKSTVPCGTSDSIKNLFTALGKPGVRFDLLSNPEFLAEGTAVRNLLKPDRVLIGSEQDVGSLRAAHLLRCIYQSWVKTDKIILMNTRSAELTKLAANALLAQRISSINALSAVCEKAGADVEEVALACGLDLRIGPGMLKASLGFGGSCLKKDVLTLAHFSDELDLRQIGSYWRSIHEINESQKSRFTARIVRAMNNTLVRKRIALLGCSFKKDTSDIRESPGVSLLADLIAEQAVVTVYDPKVKLPQLVETLSQTSRVNELPDDWRQRLHIGSSAYDTCDGALAVVIATDWDEFSDRICLSESSSPLTDLQGTQAVARVDWGRIAQSMRHPKLVFDGRNIVNGAKLVELGFDVHIVGKAHRSRS